jgi:hypothetical protein
MTCCNQNITTFINQLVSTVPYTGVRPIVDVAYLQPDNTFQTAGIFTQIEITPTDVIVSHGSLSSGVIKLLQ